MKKFGIAVHGGAGTLLKRYMTSEKEKTYQTGLSEAIEAGYSVLEKKGSALDAVEVAVRMLEDNPVFNAGKGSVFNHEGKHEMDASIMEGRNLMAGAVCAVHNIRNPIVLAKEVMLHSKHVMMCGEGAEEFARERNIQFAADDYFFVQHRYDQWQETLKNSRMQLDDGSTKKFGTVGAVALDVAGNLAAATSTGGMTNKRFGRIGDTCIIGAGTYADNSTCAISCTGHGEYFIRAVAAYDVHALIKYKNLSLNKGCDRVINKKLRKMKGEGGLIAIDRFCNIEMPFNSKGMYRGSRKYNSKLSIGIYR